MLVLKQLLMHARQCYLFLANVNSILKLHNIEYLINSKTPLSTVIKLDAPRLNLKHQENISKRLTLLFIATSQRVQNKCMCNHTFSARAVSSFSLLLSFAKIWRIAGVPNNAGGCVVDFFDMIVIRYDIPDSPDIGVFNDYLYTKFYNIRELTYQVCFNQNHIKNSLFRSST